MGSEPSQKILRVGVIQGGKVIEERHLRGREAVTIGRDAKNTLVVPDADLPPGFTLLEHEGGRYTLRFTPEMTGRVRMDGVDEDLVALRSGDRAAPNGNAHVLPLDETARGKVTVGDRTLFFQFVSPPPDTAAVQVPPLVRGSFLASVDRLFLAVLATSLLVHFSGATCIITRPAPVERELTLDELPDRFAKVLIPPKVEEQKPVEEVVEQGTEEKKEAPKETAKKETKPTGPVTKEQVREQVAQKGLLKVLGSAGSGSGAFEDLLGSGTGTAEIAEALAGAGGVGIATADAIAAGGPKGGGTGQAATIGDLGTTGGGEVNLGRKADAQISGRVRDATPEVDSADVDRDALARYVKARLKAIQNCYEKELKRNPSLKGRIVVRWTITPGGRASDIEIEENALGSEAVGACIRTIIRGWVFPFKPEDSVTVAYPFVFSPAS